MNELAIPSTGRGFVLLGTEHHFLSPNNKEARARQHGDKVLNFRDYFCQFEPEAPYTEISKKFVWCALTCAVYSPSHMRAICQAKRTLFMPVEGIAGYEAANSGSLRCALPSIGRNNRLLPACSPLLPACSPLLPQAPSVLPLKQPYSISVEEKEQGRF